jgi:hypothetical protein
VLRVWISLPFLFIDDNVLSGKGRGHCSVEGALAFFVSAFISEGEEVALSRDSDYGLLGWASYKSEPILFLISTIMS